VRALRRRNGVNRDLTPLAPITKQSNESQPESAGLGRALAVCRCSAHRAVAAASAVRAAAVAAAASAVTAPAAAVPVAARCRLTSPLGGSCPASRLPRLAGLAVGCCLGRCCRSPPDDGDRLLRLAPGGAPGTEDIGCIESMGDCGSSGGRGRAGALGSCGKGPCGAGPSASRARARLRAATNETQDCTERCAISITSLRTQRKKLDLLESRTQCTTGCSTVAPASPENSNFSNI
jgi:hypothetical protein